MVVSIIANVSDLIIASRHLAEPRWLPSIRSITPYSLWTGVLLVFAGIVIRDRGRKH